MADAADASADLHRPTPLVALWCFAVLANALKLIGLAQLTGMWRVTSGSFAAREDYDLMKAAYGPAPDVALLDSYGTPFLRRLGNIHRNEMESLPLFFALSYAYILSEPPLGEACVLLLMFTLARLAHNILYALQSSPMRSVAWGVATQCLLIIAGRVAAWICPPAAIGLQVAINAPIALQWFVSLGVLGTLREQTRRAERSDRLLARRRRGQLESATPTGRGPGLRAPLSDDEDEEEGY